MKDVIIIGGGWYGCHIANILKKTHNVTLIEQKSDIFNNSSYYNQNRLHLGYHYCRDYATRNLCQSHYEIFVEKYGEIVEPIDNNYYLISNDSFVDFNTYKHIYQFEKFDFELKPNILFHNIQGEIISTQERVINSDKAYSYFKNNMDGIHCVFDTKVIKYMKEDSQINVVTETHSINTSCINQTPSTMLRMSTEFPRFPREAVTIVSGSLQTTYECDILLDCTYNQLGWSNKKYNYELTISLEYTKMNDVSFGAITIMDGKFMSLYPRNTQKNTFTLTDVEYTPLISSSNYADIENYKIKEDEIEYIKHKMVTKLKHYYQNFENDFQYTGYFLSKKTKLLSPSDSRDITIDKLEDNVYSVNCGKIYGIFEFEKYILSELK
jgi:hypothetical protein